MRWHVDLTDSAETIAAEHVETIDLAVQTADDLLEGARAGKGMPEQVVTEAHAKIADADLVEAQPGEEFTFELGHSRMFVRLAAIPEGETDEDCQVCARVGVAR